MLAIKTLFPKSVIFRRSARLLGIKFEISVVANNPGWADERIDEAIAEINRVEKLFSTFSDDSVINEINRHAGLQPVKTNPEIFRVIDRAMQVSELTYGTFDITYVNQERDPEGLGGGKARGVKPADGALNYQGVILDANEQTVFLKEKGMRLGFGAIVNGYAADRAKYILQMQGVDSGVINAAGDLLAWGNAPECETWTVGVADPGQKAMPFAHVSISNMAIATSLNTEKHTPIINKTYTAPINARSGFPVSEIKSVSIISPSAELADAMATPVMSIGVNAGLYLINQLNQMACIIIDDQGRIYTSKDVSLSS